MNIHALHEDSGSLETDAAVYVASTIKGIAVQIAQKIAQAATYLFNQVAQAFVTLSRSTITIFKEGLFTIKAESGKVLLRIFHLRSSGTARPSYEILKLGKAFRIEAHPIASSMRWWYFMPHVHLDAIPSIAKMHLGAWEFVYGAAAATAIAAFYGIYEAAGWILGNPDENDNNESDPAIVIPDEG